MGVYRFCENGLSFLFISGLRWEGAPGIAVGADHGFSEVAMALKEQGHNVTDVGTHSKDAVDYPVFAAAVARASGRP